MGLRVSDEEEFSGMDMPKFGLAACPEFVQQTGHDYGSGNSEKGTRTIPSGQLVTHSYNTSLKARRPEQTGRFTFRHFCPINLFLLLEKIQK